MSERQERTFMALLAISYRRHWPDELSESHRVAFLRVDNELRSRLACYMN